MPVSRSDAERNRRSLLDAAAAALAENPGASMAEVARAAGLTRATLYRHFSSREALLEAMRAEALVRATEALAVSRLDEGTALDALSRAVRALVDEGLRFRAVLAVGADQDPEFRAERMRVLAPVRDVVRRGQASGVIREDLPAEWVVAVMAALLATGVRASADLPRRDGGVAELIVTTLTSGLAVMPARATPQSRSGGPRRRRS